VISPTALRAFLVEDAAHNPSRLSQVLDASADVDIVGRVACFDRAEQALRGVEVDVAFVDVEAPGTSSDAGLDFVRTLSRWSQAPLLVLSTPVREHVVEAIDLGAADCLLKPCTEKRVERCLTRVRRLRHGDFAVPRFVARRGRDLAFFHLNEVWAVEATGRLAYLHTAYGKFDLDVSLSAIEASAGGDLTRVHRSWLINAAHVRGLVREDSEMKLFVGAGVGPEQPCVAVPVARERARGVRQILLSSAIGFRGV
jgi:DNA-binding LytR/AlgR family response regulator